MKILLLVGLVVIDLFQTAYCIRVSVTCDNDLVWFYADKKAVLSWETPNADNWRETKYVDVKSTTKVYGVQCKDQGIVAGFLMSTDDGTVTDGEWRCTTQTPTGTSWLKPGYDDSCWERANVIERNNNTYRWGTRPGISTNAFWIWTKNWDNPIDADVYCRLDKSVIRIAITCDNELMEFYVDGKPILAWYSPSADNWKATKYVTVPKKTKVYALKCRDYGVVAGMLMSASDGTITDDSWRCTKQKPKGKKWLKPGFDDSNWEKATAIERNYNTYRWGTRPGISTNAYWIWTNKWSWAIGQIDTPVYCRKTN